MTLNAWNHVAVVRNSGIVYININGVVSTNSWTTSTAFTNAACVIGTNPGPGVEYYFGYLSDARLLNGTALYTSNFVPPSAPLTAVQNTSILTNMTSAGIYDAAMMTTMETVADAKLSTAVSKFGGSSMFFDGTGDYLQSPSSATATAFRTGDFTVELWVNFAANNGTYNPFVRNDGSGTFDFGYDFSTTQLKYNGSGAILAITQSFTVGTWYYIALTRASGSSRMFVNGTQVGTTATGDTNNYGQSAFKIAGSSFSGSHVLNGYIDDLRITNGYARYTSNFTAPTSAFPIY